MERCVDRLENLAVRSTEVTEAWEENGQDFVTVRFWPACWITRSRKGSKRMLEGSSTIPVKFEEYWTLTRPVGPYPWKLSAIQQIV
jgi:predicted lipid-binding transport protein (Tim44 family)